MFDLEDVVESDCATDELEEVVLGLIINSGSARSQAYAALKKAKEGDFAADAELMAQFRLALHEVHRGQTHMIDGDQEIATAACRE